MERPFRNMIIILEYEHLQKKGYRSEMITEMLGYKYCISPDHIYTILAKSKEVKDV